MKELFLAATFSVMAAAGAARAQEISYMDMTKITCHEFVALSDLQVGLMMTWADGYLTSKSGKGPAYDPARMEQLGQAFGTYCSKNPNAAMMTAFEQAWK